MKIGLVSTFNVECGIATYSEHLVEHYPRGKVTIFGNYIGSLTNTNASTKHPIIRCWSRTGDFKELTYQILKNEIDVIHFQHEYGLFQNNVEFRRMIETLKNKGVKTVITYHTLFQDRRHILNRHLFCINQFIDRIILHQEEEREIMDNDAKCVVIPHGSVKVKAKPRKESREYLQISDDKFVCTCIGFISPNKGQIDTALAINNLHREFPNIYLIIAGMPVINGHNFENLEYCLNLFRVVKRMGALDYIRVIPRYLTDEEFDYFAGASDIFVQNHGGSPYSTSGSSHLIMSYGKPSASSRSPILNDLNEERSVKFDIGNSQGIEEAVKKLMNDEDLRNKLGENSLKFAQQTSWDKLAKKHWNLYEEIHGKK